MNKDLLKPRENELSVFPIPLETSLVLQVLEMFPIEEWEKGNRNRNRKSLE